MQTTQSSHERFPTAVDSVEAYRGKNVLIAGADGFLGINFTIALVRCGANVTVLSRRANPRASVLNVRHAKSDLLDTVGVAAAVEGQHYIFDLAGVAGAVGSNSDPVGSTDKECRPHLTLFAAAAAAASKPVLSFCSSRLVYGRPDYLPVDEKHPVRPASFYAVHKLTLENYLHVLATTQGLRSTIFRLSNPYGPFWPEAKKSYGLINQFIARALAGEPIDIFGDGSQQRDYIHVDDVVTAMLAGTAVPACCGETFNLGNVEPISIRHAVETIAAEIDTAVVRFKPWPPEHLAVETGDYQTNLSKLFGFVQLLPQMTFRQGLRKTLESLKRGLGK